MDETVESRPERGVGVDQTDGGVTDPDQTGGETTGLDRTVIGYALLFSVPVWVGVTMMMLKVTGGRPLALVLAPGVVLGVAVFALVAAAAYGGYETS